MVNNKKSFDSIIETVFEKQIDASNSDYKQLVDSAYDRLKKKTSKYNFDIDPHFSNREMAEEILYDLYGMISTKEGYVAISEKEKASDLNLLTENLQEWFGVLADTDNELSHQDQMWRP